MDSENQRKAVQTWQLVYLIICSALATGALICSLLFASGAAVADGKVASPLLVGLAFGFMALLRASFVFHPRFRAQRVKNAGIAASMVLLSVFGFCIGLWDWFLNIAAAGYAFTVAGSRIYTMVKHRTKRSIAFGILFSGIFLLLGAIFIALNPNEPGGPLLVTLLLGLIMALDSFIAIFALIMSNLRKGILIKIVRESYAAEILSGLVILILASSVVLFINDETITSFGDALWYCFAVVTTIGFGDITAKTMLGRIISVILGIYGIVVVALLTSIIVNFYNESTQARAQEEKELIAQLQKELEAKQKQLEEKYGKNAVAQASKNPEPEPSKVEAPEAPKKDE
ncbi:MAG: ion transporter [Bacilli bacterium]|nr:ion transporter [Bacilli bacterium]